jgi:hypothetical protein
MRALRALVIISLALYIARGRGNHQFSLVIQIADTRTTLRLIAGSGTLVVKTDGRVGLRGSDSERQAAAALIIGIISDATFSRMPRSLSS